MCHQFCALDGKTKSPNEFGGILGKQLENCNNLPVVKFSPIPHNLPNLEIKEDLSTHQNYLLEMCASISSGVSSPCLTLKKPHCFTKDDAKILDKKTFYLNIKKS